MKNGNNYEDTQPVLMKIFPGINSQADSFTVNDYFVKNKDRYFTNS
jgi:hypothetical protein